MAVIKVPTRNRWNGKPDFVLDYSALEKGDVVAVLHSNRHNGPGVTVYTVDRTTPKQFILKTGGHNHEYRRWTESGREVGSAYGSVPTAVDHPDVLVALQAQEMRDFTRRVEKVLEGKGPDGLKHTGYTAWLETLHKLTTLVGETTVLINQLENQRNAQESTDV